MTNFVDAVLAQMGRLTESERRTVQEELEGHLEDHALLLESRGCSPEEAARQAEAAMGDPAEIGRELGKLYDPLWLWLDRLVLGLLVWLLFWGIFLGIEYLSIFMGEWGRP